MPHRLNRNLSLIPDDLHVTSRCRQLDRDVSSSICAGRMGNPDLIPTCDWQLSHVLNLGIPFILSVVMNVTFAYEMFEIR